MTLLPIPIVSERYVATDEICVNELPDKRLISSCFGRGLLICANEYHRALLAKYVF